MYPNTVMMAVWKNLYNIIYCSSHIVLFTYLYVICLDLICANNANEQMITGYCTHVTKYRLKLFTCGLYNGCSSYGTQQW